MKDFEIWCNKCHSNDIIFTLINFKAEEEYDIEVECLSCGNRKLMEDAEEGE